jgi:AbrB family looped-hinge helix DNA binding protein
MGMREFVSSVSPKGQITLPAEVRSLLGVRPKDNVVLSVEDGYVRVSPLGSAIDASYQAVPALKRKLRDRQMTDIAWEEHAEEVAAT